MKTPCETIVWHVLPVIRKEFTKSLVTHHGFTQRKTAIRLGITDAAVSRYLSGKRGNIDISNKRILKEINDSANVIANGNKKTVIQETCRICSLLKIQWIYRGNISCFVNDKKKKTKDSIKAIGLLSGGLDSTLAVKLLIDQGIEVTAFNMITPFLYLHKKRMQTRSRKSRKTIRSPR